MIEGNGKTVETNNLEKKHSIAIGTLVEVIPWDTGWEWKGVRLYVVGHGRDCDGSPLYSIGPRDAQREGLFGGFAEHNLKIIVRKN